MNCLRRMGVVLLGAYLLSDPVCAQTTGGMAVDRLRADLLAGGSATQVLTQWCTDRKLASPPVVRAVRDLAARPAPMAQVRALLKAGADEVIDYRRVRLMCGDHVLSEADNWYLPSRLTPSMNKSLDETDTPFGAVVRPLGFHRRTLEAARVNTSRSILRVRALLLSRTDVPFSLVIENYGRDLVGEPAK